MANRSPFFSRSPRTPLACVAFIGLAAALLVWDPVDFEDPDTKEERKHFAVVAGALGLLLVTAVRDTKGAKARADRLEQSHDDLERLVQERTEELQRLSVKILELQDEERRRIARELHDSTAQALSAVAINLDRARYHTQGAPDDGLADLLSDSLGLLEQALTEIRTTSFLLHPPALEQFGLGAALSSLVEGFRRRTGIDVELKVACDVGRVAREIELTLYRIAQEGLTNVHRHSRSRTARVELSRDEWSIALAISDQGRGFANVPDPAGGSAAALGVGLSGMRERVRQLHGTFSIERRLTGMTLRAVLPLPIDDIEPALCTASRDRRRAFQGIH